MTYLRIRSFWEYQNADAWKKAERNKGGHRHPAWCKLFVQSDLELQRCRPMVRLVFYEMLKLATVHANVILNDSQAIAKAISIPHDETRKALSELLKGGWILESKTARRSRNVSRKTRETFSPRVEVEKERSRPSSTSTSDRAAPGSTEPNGAADFTQDHLHLLRRELAAEAQQHVNTILATAGADADSRAVVESFARVVPSSKLADIARRSKGRTIQWAVTALKTEADNVHREQRALAGYRDPATRPDVAAVVERTARELGKRGRSWDDVGDFVNRLLEPIEDEDQRTTLRELAADAWQEARDQEAISA